MFEIQHITSSPSKVLDEISSKTFFLNKNLSKKEFEYHRDNNFFNGWDKVNDDKFRLYNCTINGYNKKLDDIIFWMKENLKGCFYHSGTHYPDDYTFIFQYKDDMGKTQKRFG